MLKPGDVLNPTGIGGPKQGEARNPSGISVAQREAREEVREWLAKPETREAGKSAYLRLLGTDNPLIVKDFMDRVAGKPKDEGPAGSGEVLLELLRQVLTSVSPKALEDEADRLEAQLDASRK